MNDEIKISIHPAAIDILAVHEETDTRVIVTVARTGKITEPSYRVRTKLDVEEQPVVDRAFGSSHEATAFAQKVAVAKLEALVDLRRKEKEVSDRWRKKTGGTVTTQPSS